MSPGRVCSCIGSVNTRTGFEVGCSRVSISEDGMFHTVVGQLSKPSRLMRGFLPRRQPNRQGSCAHSITERVSTGRDLAQMICW